MKATRRNIITIGIASLLVFCVWLPSIALAEGVASRGAQLGFTSWNETIFNALSSVGVLVAWIGGFLLDSAIYIFTVNMHAISVYFKLTDLITAIWSIIRDIFNLLFIFGLMYAGFKLILGSDDTGSKRMIGYIIVAALLINFSLYVAQVIVDFTNVVAYQISTLIQPAETTPGIGGIEIGNISSNFTSLTNLDRLGGESQTVANQAGLAVNTIGAALVLGLVFTIFYAILGFVFAAGAFILFSRFFALIFLMIFSPIMFLGWVLPMFQSYSSKWWKYFFSQAFVAPAFIFMIYISLSALNGLGRMEEYSITNLTLYLVIVTAFLWGSLSIAKSMSSWGGLQAYNVGAAMERRFRTAAGGATVGLAARGLRNTVGRMSQNYAESDKAKDRAARSRLGRFALNASSKLGDASFDARKVGGVGGKLGLGAGLQGGYKTRTEAIAKKELEIANSLGEVGDDDPTVSRLQIALEAQEQALKSKQEKIREGQKEIADFERKKKETDDKAEQERLQREIDVKKAEINQYRGEVDKHKEDIDKAREDVSREKQRRQLGDSSRVGIFTQQSISTKKGLVKAKLNAYAEEKDDNERAKLAREIAEAKKELADVEKAANQQAGGYATKVENKFPPGSKWFLGFQGRSKAQNDNAGKTIRDERKKKIKGKDK